MEGAKLDSIAVSVFVLNLRRAGLSNRQCLCKTLFSKKMEAEPIRLLSLELVEN